MSAVAGRVLLLFMGDYDSATTYKPMDVVLYGVNSYVCLLESTGNVPTNTTYWQTLAKGISNVSPEALGIGYGISQNTGASKTATLADYTLTINGIVAVTFADDVPANATLNINSQGAKPIYFRGSAIVANVIRGGDTVTFAYDGMRYNVLCIDGGAGHEIENSAGTKLSQRDVLQFGDGLEATDDSQNEKTKVGMTLPTISLADWNAMTEQEQEAYKASHYRFGVEQPDTSGVINAEYMTLLWENPNTTQAFAPQTITLNSADYDFLLWVFINASNASNILELSVISEKGKGAILQYSAVSTSCCVAIRTVTRNSDTSFSVDRCVWSLNNASGVTDNTRCVPIAIYGIKKDFQFKVNAIATELSTSAENCIMPDGVTSVANAITYKDVYSTDEHVVGKWIDGSILYEKTVDCGALPNNTTKNTAHGISNLGRVISISGSAKRSANNFIIPLPYITPSGINNCIEIYITPTHIAIVAKSDQSVWDSSYVTLRYTKTS